MKPPPPKTPWPKTVADFLSTAGFRWQVSTLKSPVWNANGYALTVRVAYAAGDSGRWCVSSIEEEGGFMHSNYFEDFGQVAGFITFVILAGSD